MQNTHKFKLEDNKKVVRDYIKKFKEFKKEIGEQKSKNDSLINQILGKFRSRTFGDTGLLEISNTLALPDNLDNKLQFPTYCRGVNPDNEVLFNCEDCEKGSQNPYDLCKECFDHQEKDSHKGHEINGKSGAYYCRTTFEFWKDKTQIISEASTHFENNPLAQNIANETYYIIFAFITYCKETRNVDLLWTGNELSEEKLRFLSSLISWINKLIDARYIARYAVALSFSADMIDIEHSILWELICLKDSFNSVFNVIGELFSRIAHIPCFSKALYSNVICAIIQDKVDYIRLQDLHFKKCYSLAIGNESDEISSLIGERDMILLLIHVQTHVEAFFNISMISGEDDSSLIEYTEMVALLSETLEIKRHSLSFCKKEEGFKILFNIFDTLQYIDHFDAKKKEYLDSEIDAMGWILQKESFILELYISVLKHLIYDSSREEVLVKNLKYLKGLLDKYEKEQMIKRSLRYVSPILPLQRGFIITLMTLCSFEGSGEDTRQINPTLAKMNYYLVECLEFTKEELAKFFFAHMKELIHVVGFFKEIYRKVWARFGDDEMQDLYNQYGASNLLFNSCDITFLQVGFNYINAKHFDELPHYFATNSHFKKLCTLQLKELMKFTEEDWFEKTSTLFIDYWSFVYILMTSSVPASNLLARIIPKEMLITGGTKLPYFAPLEHQTKEIVFCLGSLNAKKLNQLCTEYIDECVPLLPLAKSFLDFDPTTKIYRLRGEDQKSMKYHLNCEQLNKKETSSAELFSALQEKGIIRDTYLPSPTIPHYSFISSSSLISLQLSSSFHKSCLRVISLSDSLPSSTGLQSLCLKLLQLSFLALPYCDSPTPAKGLFSMKKVKFFEKKVFLTKMASCSEIGVRDFARACLGLLDHSPLPDQHQQNHNNNKKSRNRREKKGEIQEEMRARQMRFLEMMGGDNNGEDIHEAKIDRITDTCFYCLEKIKEIDHYVTPSYMRFDKDENEQYFIALSCCGHFVHADCFTKLDLYKNPKKKAWFWQYSCLQCKRISNTPVAFRGDSIDMSYLQDTYKEQYNYVKRILSADKVSSSPCLYTALAMFFKHLYTNHSQISLSLLLKNLLPVYRLVLEYLKTKEIDEVQKQEEHCFDLIVRILLSAGKLEEICVELLIAHNIKNGDLSTTTDDLRIVILAVALLMDKRLLLRLTDEDFEKINSTKHPPTHELDELLPKIVDFKEVSELYRSKANYDGLAILTLSKFSQIRFVELSENYVDELLKFFHSKCDFCKSWQETIKDETLLCLQCGIHICMEKCESLDSDQELSNALQHAMLAHSGTCVYLSFFKSNVYVYELPVRVKFSSLYVDEFGFPKNEMERLIEEMDVYEYSKKTDFKLQHSSFKKLEKLAARGMLIEEISKKAHKAVNTLRIE